MSRSLVSAFGIGSVVSVAFPGWLVGAPNNGIGVAGRASYNTLNLTITNTINYKTTLAGGHDLNFLVGHEGVDYRYEGFQAIAQGQNNDYLTTMSSGSRVVSWGDITDAYSYLSFFARGELVKSAPNCERMVRFSTGVISANMVVSALYFLFT